MLPIAASILTAACRMLKHGTSYQNLGPTLFDNRNKARHAVRQVNRWHSLRFEVQITLTCYFRVLILTILLSC